MTGALIALPVQMLSKVSRKRGALSGHSVVSVCVFKAPSSLSDNSRVQVCSFCFLRDFMSECSFWFSGGSSYL